MALISNSAFSRTWIIRLSEAYTARAFPFAIELVEEKAIAIIRSSSLLRLEGTRFTLDSIQEKENNIKIHASHILGLGLTINLLKSGEYQTEVQIIVCHNNLRRNIKIEENLILEIKSALLAHS